MAYIIIYKSTIHQDKMVDIVNKAKQVQHVII